ncbi:MAG: DUF2269 family protein [Methylocystis sp.]
MYKAFKTLHIVGMALFLGGIFAHIAAGRVPGAETEPTAMVFARQAIDLATRYVTVPGLGLTIVSGLLMALLGPGGALKRRWQLAHMALAAVVVAVTFIVMIPVGREILGVALAIAAGGKPIDAFAAVALPEHIWGGGNIVLILLAVAIGVAADSDLFRPGIPTRSRPPFRFEVGRRSEMKAAAIPT